MYSGNADFLKKYKSSCAYCGNNPVPHRLYWYNESLNIWLTPLRQKFLYNGFTKLIKKRGLDEKLARFFLSVGEKLKIISRQKDISKCKVARALVLWQEAEKRGIDMQELLIFGYPFDMYEARLKIKDPPRLASSETGLGLKTITFSGLPRPSGYTNKWLDLMDDKWLFKKKFMDEGLPVPLGASCSSFSQAKSIFTKIQERSVPIPYRGTGQVYGRPGPMSPMNRHATQPVIVKPRAGSRGRHSTTFISDERDLHQAFKIAKRLCYWVMVEDQLSGPVYRATVVNFELCGVLRGDPPQVVGDGENRIADLIQTKNKAAHPGVKDIATDEAMGVFLERSVPIYGRSLTPMNRHATAFDYIPEKGQTINLSEKIGVNYGGSSSEDFEICHPDNKELFIKAAKILGDPIVGFDFIIPDISKSYKDQKSGFIEVNSLPFINLHHDPLLGKPRNIAAKVWEMAGFAIINIEGA